MPALWGGFYRIIKQISYYSRNWKIININIGCTYINITSDILWLCDFLFFSYESRDDIALAVRIPFGYSSMNAELVAKDILDYYYGLSDDILSGQANSNGVASVRAD